MAIIYQPLRFFSRLISFFDGKNKYFQKKDKASEQFIHSPCTILILRQIEYLLSIF